MRDLFNPPGREPDKRRIEARPEWVCPYAGEIGGGCGSNARRRCLPPGRVSRPQWPASPIEGMPAAACWFTFPRKQTIFIARVGTAHAQAEGRRESGAKSLLKPTLSAPHSAQGSTLPLRMRAAMFSHALFVFSFSVLVTLLAVLLRLRACTTGCRRRFPAPTGEWRTYGGDLASTRYCGPWTRSIEEISTTLQVAWRFKTDAFWSAPGKSISRARPLMAGGILYATVGTRRAVVALDAGHRRSALDATERMKGLRWR